MSGSETAADGALVAAAHWLEGLVQGSLAVTLAMLAVAATAMLMLSGRLSLRRGLVVTSGCFILFGAPLIARGIVGSATSISSPQSGEFLDQRVPPHVAPEAMHRDQLHSDPYAGASVSAR